MTDEDAAPNKPRGKKKLIFIPLILLLLIALGVGGWLYTHRGTTPIPEAVQQAVSFPIYYSAPPAGYEVENNSFSAQGGVLTFYYANGNKKIVVTEQTKPSGYDFSQLSGDDEFNTAIGRAYVVDFDTRTTGSVVGTKTWIIVNATPPIGDNSMKQLLSSMRQVN